MNRDEKAAVVEEIAGEIQGAEAIFAVDYRGLSVAQAADLRAKLRDADTHLRIVKNSLSERAAEMAGAHELKALLAGPTALAFVRGDAALAAKALNDAARALNILEFKGGMMNGSALSADDVRSIARLPPRDVLNAQLVGMIAAPITGLVRGLNALIVGLAIQLQAIADMDPPILVRGEAGRGEGHGGPVAAAPPVAAGAPAAAVPEPEPADEPASEPAAEVVAAAVPEPAAEVPAAAEPVPEPATEVPAAALSELEPEVAEPEPEPPAAAVSEPEPEVAEPVAEPPAAAAPEAAGPPAAPEPEPAAEVPAAVPEPEPSAAPELVAALDREPAAREPEQPEAEAASDAEPSDD